jgi:geranylgeranyl diphosphate synthase type I
MMDTTLAQFSQTYKPQVDEAIAEELERRQLEAKEISLHLVPIVEAMKELSVGGKRLRALLLILGYQLSGKEVNGEVIRVAAAIELFHLGLMIQDDVMDQDEKRRGVATIHARYDDKHLGETIATLAGDYTYGWCSEILSSLELDPTIVNRALRVWSKYFTRVGYGQTLDTMAIADNVTILKILSIKSGEYSCVMPLLIGASLGEGNQELLVRLEKYGMELGHVFQLRDDWLGMYGDPDKTGKPVGHDEREGKHTYAVLNGKEKTEAEIAKHLEDGLRLADSNPVMNELLQWMASREN